MSTVNTDQILREAPELDLEPRRGYEFARRVRDIVLSLVALLVLWPLMLIVAIAVVIDSPGAGPIFVQTRIGKNGKPFTFYKFRSMYPDAEDRLKDLLPFNEMEGPTFKIKDDPRITRVGKFIRKTSVDELPQLWNVLKGEMSLVGPRPAIPREVEQYDDRARQRLSIKPGLTCIWQVQPDRNSLSFDEWLEMDLEYINTRSLRLDTKLIFATFRAVFGMNGI